MSKTVTHNGAAAVREAGGRATQVLVALATLAGLAVVPVALVQLGLPTVSEVRSAVSLRWMPPELGGHLVALVGWAAWVYVVAWLGVAVIAEVRGSSRKLPRLLRPALVPVVSVVMSLFVRSPAAPHHAMAAAAAVSAAPVSPPPAPAPATPSADRQAEWVVEEGQSLWSIAETVYGDGEQCLRIAAANPGLDPRELQVGQVLRVPPAHNSAGHAPQQWRVQKGESLWSIAEAVYSDGDQWERIAAANRGREVAPGQVFSDPALIEPGWMLQIPTPMSPMSPEAAKPAPVAPPAPDPSSPPPASHDGEAIPAPGGPAGHVATPVGPGESGKVQPGHSASLNGTAPRMPRGGRDVSASSTGSSHSQTSGDALAEVVVSLGLAAVAAGVAATLRLRRRVQQRRRRTGRRITLPPRSLTDLEATLSAAGRSERDLVDGGMRFLTASLRDTGLRVPEILAVRRGETDLDLFLAERAKQAPPPFVAVNNGTIWRLDVGAASDVDLATVDEIAPCPTLVTAGADEDGAWLVHLEAARFMACGGDLAKAMGGLASMAVEMATSAWEGRFELALVDFPATMAGLQGVRHASFDDALAEAEAHGRANGIELARDGLTSPSAAVLSGEPDALSPFVVVCGRQLVAAEEDRVARVTGSRPGGVAVLALGQPAAARWQLAYNGEQVSVSPLGLRLRSSRLESDELEGVDALLATATAEDCGADSEPYADHAPAGDKAAQTEIEVRLLGPVEVVGGAQPISKSLGLELVAFLATRSGGVTTEVWTTALRPKARLARSSINNATSIARHGLGRARDGEWHMPENKGELRLRPTVGTDWARFRALARSESPDDWDKALGLVRGEPFAGADWDWTVREGLVASMQAEVVDLAVAAAEAALERREPERAAAAADSGIAGCPWDERAYRLLMRTCAAQGNVSGVHAVMRRLCTLLEDEVEPFDAIEPETRQLFSQLTARRRTATG